MELRVDRDIAQQRMDICKGCDRLFQPTKTCKECGCFMAIKVWVGPVSCPLGKWAETQIDNARSDEETVG